LNKLSVRQHHSNAGDYISYFRHKIVKEPNHGVIKFVNIEKKRQEYIQQIQHVHCIKTLKMSFITEGFTNFEDLRTGQAGFLFESY